MELIQSEGRVFDARYYTIEPTWAWDVGWYNQYWNDMVAWCVKEYGPTTKDAAWTPGMRWYVNNAKFWFREKDDLMYFILRWS